MTCNADATRGGAYAHVKTSLIVIFTTLASFSVCVPRFAYMRMLLKEANMVLCELGAARALPQRSLPVVYGPSNYSCETPWYRRVRGKRSRTPARHHLCRPASILKKS